MIELLVAVAILVLMIAGVGYVFSNSSRAVRLTQATIETNAAVRAAMARLREDMQSITNDGALAICNATADQGINGAPTPTVLAFTATGRFQSRFDPTATANSALIVYMPVADQQGGPDILARYVFLLTGDRNRFASLSLGDWLGTSEPPTPLVLDELAKRDCLGASLADIRAFIEAGRFYPLYVQPLLTCYARLNSAPQTLAYDSATRMGGIENLWPYLAGGCDRFQILFYDGRDADLDGNGVADPVADYPGEPVAWMDPGELRDSIGARIRDSRREEAGNPVVGVTAMPGPNALGPIIWDYRNKSLWPQALQLKLELRDAAGRLENPRRYEGVFELP